MTTLGDLAVWPVGELAKVPDLDEVLVRADNDHRLPTEAMLLIRSTTIQPRRVQVVSTVGGEAEVSVSPATLRASVKYPLGHAPADTVIGPCGPGPVTYLPSTRGLRVVAYSIEPGTGKEHDHGT